VEFAAELQASLKEFTASGILEVRENGGHIAPFSGMSWEVLFCNRLHRSFILWRRRCDSIPPPYL
jgi:hypothetical protein